MVVVLGVVVVVRVVVVVVAAPAVDVVGTNVLDATLAAMFTMVVVGIKKYIT